MNVTSKNHTKMETLFPGTTESHERLLGGELWQFISEHQHKIGEELE